MSGFESRTWPSVLSQAPRGFAALDFEMTVLGAVEDPEHSWNLSHPPRREAVGGQDQLSPMTEPVLNTCPINVCGMGSQVCPTIPGLSIEMDSH
jgi:hypothetical protein